MPRGSHGLLPQVQDGFPVIPNDGRPGLLLVSERPILLVKLTGYRLLNMAVLVAFGTAKAILSYMGKSVAPTVLDWILGVALSIMFVLKHHWLEQYTEVCYRLYWMGQYESVQPPVLPWLFHVDYAPQAIFLPIHVCKFGMYVSSLMHRPNANAENEQRCAGF